MKVLTYPNPKLLKESKRATVAEGNKIVAQLHKASREQTWGQVVGLAAPQIGINKRVFIALGRGYINPEIAEATQFHQCFEGCYSLEVDKYDYPVSRPNLLTLRWQEPSGEVYEQRFSGFEAQVIHHEFDHLEGKLCSGQSE